MTHPPEKVWLGAGYALATALVMSVAAALIKHTATLVSIELIVAVQYLLCTLLMLPFFLNQGITALATQRFSLHLLRALCGWACFYTYYLAIAHIPLVDAVLLRNAAPLCIPVLVLLLFKVQIGWQRWLMVILGFIGIALIIKPQGNSLNGWHLVGFGSALTLAGSILTTRVLTRTEPTQRVLFYYFALSALLSLPPLFGQTLAIPLKAWLPLLLIGASIWLTMWLYTQAYRFAKASVISPLSYCGVVFTGFWGWYFWDHLPDSKALVGVLLVVIGGTGSVVLGARQLKHSQAATTEQ